MARTGFITSGVGPSPSEERRAKENEAAIVPGTMCRASWRSTWRHMQFDEGCAFRSRASRSTGCAKTIPQSGTHWVACRMHAMHPEWSYETSSITCGRPCPSRLFCPIQRILPDSCTTRKAKAILLLISTTCLLPRASDIIPFVMADG
jgi:hypothetical protein